ncbi:16S rRNA (uracil(1498)-N(3))-methyltransferase [Parasulfuritortus cantonensis]|uniref:Ribosomal RNA small subunit methyltransferase E n=1 Tax=Parasulfuritortus cantonensis TaxID=2528202 RepID=A0A4R1B8F8_9PROT|nr:16S rRNA (uracil(1498)-N(3))-methyltransferase [Parasulfuritortus cantonensis]TCJ12905.1 16S rRNA (uracil(1498)-N(3))-methyltransferase [Parasulfuritortus cantonensis]
MPIPRFHCAMPLPPGRRVALPDAVARHAVGVLRLRDGDDVILFNGDGSECLGQLIRTGKGAEVDLKATCAPARESPFAITLVQGVSSGERMDYTLQKAVELGVTRIQPIMMKRTIVRLDEDKRVKRRQHWQGVVIAACEQCGRNHLPEVDPILDFHEWLATASARDGVRLLLDPEASQRLRELPAPAGAVTLLAGPEGGFDPNEREMLRRLGFLPMSLGPRILRTETAAITAMAVIQGLWGDI